MGALWKDPEHQAERSCHSLPRRRRLANDDLSNLFARFIQHSRGCHMNNPFQGDPTIADLMEKVGAQRSCDRTTDAVHIAIPITAALAAIAALPVKAPAEQKAS